MRPDDRDFMIDLLYRRSGLALDKDKQYLLESRLLPIARSHGFSDFSELIATLRATAPENLLSEITEAMMTHESSFFRDGKPFEYLRKVFLPQLCNQADGDRILRIWSAACSTGQEPYSIAMTLLEEAAKYPGFNYNIIATDLSAKALERARHGTYSQFEVQRGISTQMLTKYFRQTSDATWQVNDDLRGMVRFQKHNLLDKPSLNELDLVFCRHVLFYFDERAKRRAFKHLHQALRPQGYLMLGGTESVIDQMGFRQLEGMHGIYQKIEVAQPGRNAADQKFAHPLKGQHL